MAKVEIDETELVKLQNVAAVVNRMLANPESRRKILEAHKAVNPNAVVPELDAAKPLNDAIGAISAEVKEFKKAIEDKETARETAANKAAFEGKWLMGRKAALDTGYTEDGIKKLEEFMVEHGIADHKIAMPSFEREHPLPAAVTSSNQGFDAFQAIANTNEEMKRLMETQGQDPSAVRNLISKTLTDVRSGGR